jgi:hypothetical protein
MKCVFLFEPVQIRGLNGFDFFKDVEVRFGSVVPLIGCTQKFRFVADISFDS